MNANDLPKLVYWLQSASESLPDLADPTLCSIAEAIASKHGHERVEAFWAEIDHLNGKGEQIRAGLAGMMQGIDCPDAAPSHVRHADIPSAPPLPADVQLTPAQEALAGQACPWLDDYVSFASAASPMTPREFHIAAGLFVGSLVIARRVHLSVSVQANSRT